MYREGSREAIFGRRVELVIRGELQCRCGVSFLDIAGLANGSAPLVHHNATVAAASPDFLGCREVPLLIDAKGKTARFRRRNEWEVKPDWIMRPGYYYTAEPRAIIGYEKTAASLKIPVVLCYVHLDIAKLSLAFLDELDEWYPSQDPDDPRVNFPERLFHHICAFDPDRLREFCTCKDPLSSDAERRLQQLVDTLQPEQLEFSFLREHAYRVFENRRRGRTA